MYGSYLNVSNRSFLDEGKLRCTQQSQGDNRVSPRGRQTMSNTRSYRLDRRESIEQEEAHEEIRQFHRNPSYQVMGDMGGLELEESDDVPKQREYFGYNEDDDETTEEIAMLMKNHTFSSEQGHQMLENIQKRRNVGIRNGDLDDSRSVPSRRKRRSFQRESDDEQAEEIRELMRNNTLSACEGENRLHGLQSQGNRHRAGIQRACTSSTDNPCEFDSDGLPLNWSRDEVMSHSMFRLIHLNKGDPECDQIYQDMEKSGLEVVKVERLQNLDSLEKFQSEVKHLAKRRTPGKKNYHRYQNKQFS